MSVLATVLAASVVADVAPVRDVEPLEEIVITANAFRHRADQSVEPVTVLGGNELQQQSTASLGETLAALPGISSTWFGPVASRPIIRGVGGSRIQMLEDGLPAPDASSLSDDHAVAIEPSLAEQIEVLRGPAALLFGSTAAGGVVNVVTDRLPENKPDAPLHWEVGGRLDSTLGERSVDHQLGYTHDDYHLHWSWSKRLTNDVEGPSGTIANTASDSYSGSLAATKFFDSGSAGVALSRLASQYGLPGTETSFIKLREDAFNLRALRNFDDAWFDRASLRFGAGRYEHTEFEDRGVAGTTYGNHQQEARLTFERLRSNAPSVVVGAQIGQQDFTARGEEAFVPASTTRTAALFGTASFAIDRVNFEFGVRADRQSIRPDADASLAAYTGNALSASAGLLWRATENVAWSANLTRTSRLPQSTELFANGVHGALERVEIGQSTLARETGRTLDLGWRYKSRDLEASVSSFFNRYRDYTYIDPTGETDLESGLPVFKYRQAEVEFFGAEASVARIWALGGERSLRLHSSADLVRGRVRNGTDLPAIPPVRLISGAHIVDGASTFGFDVQRVLSQNRIALNETPTAGYTLLSIDATREFSVGSSKLMLFLRGTNLLNETARIHSSALKDVMPLPGRGVKLGFTLTD